MKGLLLLLLLAAPAAAVHDSEDSLRDVERFGIDRFIRPGRRLDPAAVQRAANRFNAKPSGGIGAASLSSGGRGARPAEEAARAFLTDERGELGVEPSQLAPLKETVGNGHRHVLYRQTYRGLPVEFSRVKVHLDADGAITGAHSSFEPDLNLDVTPAVGPNAAAQTAIADAGGGRASDPELVVFPDPAGGPRLAWKVTVRGPGGLWRYYVDARGGGLLFRYNDLRFQLGPCVTSGTATAQVYNLNQISTTTVEQPIRHLKVYVVDGSTYAVTDRNGVYCSQTGGKIFTQLQGPYVNVANFRGPSVHFDNGSGAWSTAVTPVSSPHPYPNSSVLVSTMNLAALAPTAVKMLPVFTSFDVGAVIPGGVDSGEVSDDDQVQLIDADDRVVASYVGSRGAFRGQAVPGRLLRIRLKSNASGQHAGYDVSVSSYMTLTSPTSQAASNNVVLRSTHSPENLRSELSLFYHLNLMHDYFMDDVNRSSAAFIDQPVNAMAFVGPGIRNAFYDPDYDNLLFGDLQDSSPSDVFTDDATVPRHEYTHFVVEKIWPIQNFGQAGAISEAIADYFSASSLNSPSIGRGVVYALSGGGPGSLRELDCASSPPCRQFGGNTSWSGEIHDDSVPISQALWGIRQDRITALGAANGRSCVDGLVFQSLLFFPESLNELGEALRRVDASGAVAACGGAGSVAATITTQFSTHGLALPSGGADVWDQAGMRNDGFQTAVDVSTLAAAGPLSATIYPGGDIDFYSLTSGAGEMRVLLELPASGFFYKGYALQLFDSNHRVVAQAAPPYDGQSTTANFCNTDDCQTTASRVELRYQVTTPGQFYVQVAGGETCSGCSNSGVNSTLPYRLTASVHRAGVFNGTIVTAAFDNDLVDFTVRVTTFPRTQAYNFAYAQLRDQSLNVLPNTRTQTPAAVDDYLTMVSSTNALGEIRGRLALQPGFSRRFPSVGTVHLEIFGYNVFGSTFSLGLSQPLNLTTDRTSASAWNNVMNPRLGQYSTVKYEVQRSGRVTLKLYTLSGTHVATLFDDVVAAGKGSVDWFGRNSVGRLVSSGVYLLRVEGPGLSKTEKIVVAK